MKPGARICDKGLQEKDLLNNQLQDKYSHFARLTDPSMEFILQLINTIKGRKGERSYVCPMTKEKVRLTMVAKDWPADRVSSG